jgi:hypothetical protein
VYVPPLRGKLLQKNNENGIVDAVKELIQIT